MSEEVAKEEVKSTWGGFFSFTNQLGQTITSGTAKHWTSDFGTESIDLSGLGDGDVSLAQAFTTDTSSTDHWAFNVVLADSSSYSVGQKNCGFETEDSGGTVRLQAIIKGSTHSFYISMPKSSDCSTSF